MTLPADFFSSLSFVDPKEIIQIYERKNLPKHRTTWDIKNEIKPLDLYCYFGARFGQPNGIQNLLRSEGSDNLIHWEWFLSFSSGFIMIQGMNFRTKIHIFGIELPKDTKVEFVSRIKSEFSNFGSSMGKVRKALEHWTEFVNPYQRLRKSVLSLQSELENLDLNLENDDPGELTASSISEGYNTKWDEQLEKYNRAIGLCFGLRSMLPVMVEAFVNLLLYALMKQELKSDTRLRENIIRQPIDIRIKSLPLNCIGFSKQIDFENQVCKKFHSLMNDRNDLLHGNVVIDKLKFNELYFLGNVPVFEKYLTMWERTIGVIHRSVGIEKIKEDTNTVEEMINYLLSCIEDKLKPEVQMIVESFDLGQRMDSGRLGILFSSVLADFVCSAD